MEPIVHRYFFVFNRNTEHQRNVTVIWVSLEISNNYNCVKRRLLR